MTVLNGTISSALSKPSMGNGISKKNMDTWFF